MWLAIDTIDYVTGIGNALYCAIKNAGTLRVMLKTNNLPRLGHVLTLLLELSHRIADWTALLW